MTGGDGGYVRSPALPSPTPNPNGPLGVLGRPQASNRSHLGRLWVPRTRSRYIVQARRGASARTSAGPTRPAAVQTASTDQARAVGSKAPLVSGENTAEEPAEIITHTIHRE